MTKILLRPEHGLELRVNRALGPRRWKVLDRRSDLLDRQAECEGRLVVARRWSRVAR
jgi:hypothetical protein